MGARRAAGSSEAILELLVIPVGLHGPLDSFREAQQQGAHEQCQTDGANDVKKSAMSGPIGTISSDDFFEDE